MKHLHKLSVCVLKSAC